MICHKAQQNQTMKFIYSIFIINFWVWPWVLFNGISTSRGHFMPKKVRLVLSSMCVFGFKLWFINFLYLKFLFWISLFTNGIICKLSERDTELVKQGSNMIFKTGRSQINLLIPDVFEKLYWSRFPIVYEARIHGQINTPAESEWVGVFSIHTNLSNLYTFLLMFKHIPSPVDNVYKIFP